MNRSPQPHHHHHHVEEEEEELLSPSQLLQIAETHLRLRNFSLCRQYALESQQPNDPNSLSNRRQASQLLTISNTLSSPTNFYSILQIDTFSNDPTLIRSQFKHLLSILDPIEEKSPLAKEALNLVWKAYACLTDPAKKSQFDSQLAGQTRESEVGDEKVATFWTFCPYCFYMYEYARVYEGCCLRCQNQVCRRGFHAVVVNSLPNMVADKGEYFGCFGYFPLGFAPDSEGKKMKKKFDSWSPIVGLFPVRRIGKTRAGRVDADDHDNVDCTNSVEIESDGESENEQGFRRENYGGNVEEGVDVNARKGRGMKRKSVAWSAKKLMSKRRRSNEGVVANNGYEGEDEEYDLEGENDGSAGVGDGSGLRTEDMAFFEEDGEIFVEFGPDGTLL